ncbi:family 43 glycosylhydrolase [Sediminitomix flava]|uniref:Glycosyl hydrolase family 43 n=1 Tax=Sediminitomix flava TaxID=379075 RepID=A0A315Z562_SEDFL|nr:family 43 glycosylhydrolase [Sediminitomix flava]PWJ37892.1 glycosyl hydrolase family 43 [Sediminitomix flava]
MNMTIFVIFRKLTFTVVFGVILLACTPKPHQLQGSIEEGNASKNQISKKEQLEQRKEAVHLMDGVWMRDPFIHLAKDGYYYLSCTRRNSDYPSAEAAMQFYRSADLVDWEDLGVQFDYRDYQWAKELDRKSKERGKTPMIWAPEIYQVDNKWLVLSTSNLQSGTLMRSKGNALEGPFEEIFKGFGHQHDPALFFEEGKTWLVSKCAEIRALKPDFSGYEGETIKIGPSDRKLGHEGCYIFKIDDKYVLFGTAWSTDQMRKGSYNLYYCTADQLTGPYGPRKFAGRFMGHGTPFQDKEGKWWCTAFLNGTYTSREAVDAGKADNGEKAYTINKQGLTLVPMDIRKENGEIVVEVYDSLYAKPGKEEVQNFNL